MSDESFCESDVRVTLDRVADDFQKNYLKEHERKRGSLSDFIGRHERVYKERYGKGPPAREAVYGYISHCRGCGADLSEQYASGCPLRPREGVKYYFPERLVDEKVLPCHACGRDPRSYSGIMDAAFVQGDKQPWFDMAFPPETPGYVEGKGLLVTGRAHQREIAKRYGYEVR